MMGWNWAEILPKYQYWYDLAYFSQIMACVWWKKHCLSMKETMNLTSRKTISVLKHVIVLLKSVVLILCPCNLTRSCVMLQCYRRNYVLLYDDGYTVGGQPECLIVMLTHASMFFILVRIIYLNPSSMGLVYTYNPNLVITVPADALAPKGHGPSAGTVLSSQFFILVRHVDCCNPSSIVLYIYMYIYIYKPYFSHHCAFRCPST